MRRTVAVGILLACAAALGAPVAAKEAASVAEVGWWSRRPGASPALDGAFEVARGPDGEDLSVAAVRITISAPSLSSARLVLRESGGTLPDRAVLRACRTSSGWTTPANPGAMDDAPVPDCSASVPLERGGTRWTGDVRLLLSGAVGQASVMVVTDPPEQALPVDPGFRVTFAGASVVAEASAARPPPRPAADEPPPDVPAAEPDLVAAPPVDPAPVVAPVAVPAPPVRAAPAQDEGSFPTQAVTSDDDGRPKPWGRLLFFVPLSVLVGAAVARVRTLVAARAG